MQYCGAVAAAADDVRLSRADHVGKACLCGNMSDNRDHIDKTDRKCPHIG